MGGSVENLVFKQCSQFTNTGKTEGLTGWEWTPSEELGLRFSGIQW